MRGRRAAISKKKADLILVAARYEAGLPRLSLAKGFARRGKVWGDVQLFGRSALIERLAAGERLFTGRLGELEGDFELFDPVQIRQGDGADPVLRAGNGNGGPGDDLALPVF